MSSWGRTKTTKKNATVSGVLRTTSTYAAPAPRRVGTGDTRIAASTVPSVSASTDASAVSASVVTNPCR